MAESLPYRKRGAGYGAYSMMSSLPSTFTVLPEGVIIDSIGLLNGFRIVLICSSFISALVFTVRAKFFSEPLGVEENEKSNIDLKESFILAL